ncbi:MULTISPECIES: hypothetical protein [Nocardia]|uniref:hypothetical protein n=1 Tax=Nocardia TaxID=1817 RepID=UPI000FDC87F0|nr:MULTISPECIES: hypothetical protein [Nocardia]MBF6314098.1 hypothetical protein [Nocardia farcinica]UEX20737.1 hypothetical protein LMJ57_17040 [Nocardia farcinica]
MTRLSRNHLLYQSIRDAGWTYEEVADKINDLVERSTGRRGLYTGDSVLRLVNGSVSWPHLRYREALCRLFGVAPGQLGLANPRTTSVRVKEVDVDRQEFLRTLAAVPVIAALPAPQPTIRSTERNVPRCVGIEHAQRVNAWAEEFRQGDDAGNGAFEGMTVQLVRAREFLQATMPPPVERELKAAVATLHRVVGWARYDRGDHAGALNDWNEGYDLIGDDGPRWLRAALLTCMARQAIYLGHLDYALDKLGIAAIRADKLSLLRRADITAVKARAFGAQGNHRECVRAVIEAESLFNEAADEDHPDLAHEGFSTYYSAELLAADLAHGLFTLSFQRGLELGPTMTKLEAARRLPDAHARSRLRSTAQLAALHLRHGDPEHGVVLAHEVLADARGTTSARVIRDICRIHRLTTDSRIKTSGPVAELCDKTAVLLDSL